MRNIIDIYRKTFEAWNKERTALSVYSAKTDETYTYTPAENEEFRQCHLEDTCENRKQKFFKARHALSKRWWISERGTIIRVEGSKKKGYHVTLYLGQCTRKGRLQVRRKKKVYARETIVGLVFPDKIPVIDPGTAAVIERKGLNAFRKARGNMSKAESVELHHVNGYVKSKNMKEAFENMKENCNPKYIRFLQAHTHKVLSKVGNHVKNLYAGNESVEDIQAFSAAVTSSGVEEPVFYIPGEKRNTGDICRTPDVTLENGLKMSINNFATAFLTGVIDGEGNILEKPVPVVTKKITKEE